ncbi:MAG TPA: SCO family protein [Verrucomicrobiota bacterium]|nr:SCO family protein [Verrucomicrobiota bacterium]HNT14861.1 SCO family protein [Verrucomicrobiota bacterium]
MSGSDSGVAVPQRRADAGGRDLKLFYGFIALLVAVGAGLVLLWPASPAPQPLTSEAQSHRRLTAFALTNQLGQLTTSAGVAGKFLVVNFIHTSCSISCLQVNHQMAEVQRLTKAQPDVQLLSLTVDPASDTPPVLAKFGAQFGTDPNRWQMLTGRKSDLYALIATSFLGRAPAAQADLMPGGFADTDRIAVVDRSGRVRRYFDGMRTETPAAIVTFLDALRSESEKI